MQEPVKLKDQSEALIHELAAKDVEASLAFFRSLSEEDRAYLRRDVRKREMVERRIREVEAGTAIRLVAVAGNEIVADGSLEFFGEEWKRHVGELRLFVARSHRRKGLGSRMARELFLRASGAKLEEIVVRLMRPQKAACCIFRKLGFHQEVVLPDYVRDLGGRKQDLIVMRCDLEALWREMEDFVATGDWQRTQ